MSNNQIRVFGLHAVESLLRHQPERILRLLVQQKRNDEKMDAVIHLAKDQGIAIETMTRQSLDKITKEATHQGVVAECVAPRVYGEQHIETLISNLTTPAFVLVLDGVQDPHNLGACFRSAEAAGVNLIIAPKDKSVGLTPTVSKVACGATEIIPFVQVTNLVRALDKLKSLGLWIYGAAAEAKTAIYQADFTGPVAIVLGAEGTGLRRLTQEHCDVLVKIPMLGSVASLNVSVAAGIFLFEVLRQRGQVNDWRDLS